MIIKSQFDKLGSRSHIELPYRVSDWYLLFFSGKFSCFVFFFSENFYLLSSKQPNEYILFLQSETEDSSGPDYIHQEENFTLKNLNQNPKKAPVDNFVFLKTYKTGSSTLQNILCRRVEHNNLTVLLPKS